ncbi:asparagine synthase (glutamine-hydrolyzing) [Flavobacteriaceae bacterium S356]|uniref:asparagine synthase (glutamine-hydrolyzing) n=1 Tax=Asprobacillus argus TaxID=3076534 RepID=A0ABU3LDZ9_9FLAO|nr:asparagine synthase (glutamine-hydrolyzing) [Flavobacteriaceae bacterium S356]
MCGIAGILGEKASRASLEAMLDKQMHRGPDDTGIYIDDKIALGHNRLSIIDLSPEANQPFHDVTKRYYVIFNGEIYNYLELRKDLEYPFSTSSDTEVLLAAYIKWGSECLHKLNGMFSFAIWDSEHKKLFAARDRFGVKPFYYHQDRNNFVFASEIKTLHALGINKEPNRSVWANYFCYGSYGMPTETFWKNIHQLQGGHYLEIDRDEISINRWYCFEDIIKEKQAVFKDQDVRNQYVELLKDSIRLRFRADVTVGFNISGGLDSSTLLSFVNQTQDSERINAYTFYTNNEMYDELPWAREMIEYTEHPLHEVLLSVKEVKSLALKIHDYQEEPYGGIPTIAYAKIFEKARKDNVLVLLDGQGMDEQWAGYDYYFNTDNQQVIQGVKTSPFRKNVLSDELLTRAQKPEYPEYFEDELLNKQYRDLFYTKIPRALRFNDRISMAYSTELREPFLDHRLVEFAFALPKKYKIREGVQKYLLREIVSETLSSHISYAPKRPLQTPQREWLSKELSSLVGDSLERIKNSVYSDWFKTEALEKEWILYKQGNNDSSFHIWQWLSLAFIIDGN